LDTGAREGDADIEGVIKVKIIVAIKMTPDELADFGFGS
jgi:hypothetical protein